MSLIEGIQPNFDQIFSIPHGDSPRGSVMPEVRFDHLLARERAMVLATQRGFDLTELSSNLDTVHEFIEDVATVDVISTDWDHTICDAGAALKTRGVYIKEQDSWFDLNDDYIVVDRKNADGKKEKVVVKPHEDQKYSDDDVVYTLKPDDLIENDSVVDERKLSRQEKRIIDNLVELSLRGVAISVITGKGVNIHPMKHYVHKRVEALSQEMGNKRHHNTGRLMALNDNPVVITFTTGNGGRTEDLFETNAESKFLHFDTFKDEFWDGMATPEIVNLLQASTDVGRTEQLRQKTPQLTVDGSYKKTGDSITDRINQKRLLGKVLCISPDDTKANIVFDIHKILENKEVNDMWVAVNDGHPVTNRKEIEEAFKKVIGSIPATGTWAHANGVSYYDLTPEGVEKGANVDIVSEKIKDFYALYGHDYHKLVSLQLGDGPNGNDKTMVRRRGGWTNTSGVVEDPDSHGYPVHWKFGGKTELERTDSFLQFVLAARFGVFTQQ